MVLIQGSGALRTLIVSGCGWGAIGFKVSHTARSSAFDETGVIIRVDSCHFLWNGRKSH